MTVKMAYEGEEMLEILKLTQYYPSKLSYIEATKIRRDEITGGDFGYGLKIVIQLLKYNYQELDKITSQINEVNSNKDVASESTAAVKFSYQKSRKSLTSAKLLNPMDVMTVVLNCCDELLRQILIEKQVSAKVAVPVLLPAVKQNGSKPVVLNWSLRSIIPNCPKSTLEHKYLTDTENPIISFIRIGKLHVSKSNLLNTFITKTNHNASFYHRGCPNGTAKRGPSNGSVEAAWFQSSDYTDEDFQFDCKFFTILNLRGDANDFPMQTKLLCECSSLVVIMADSVDSLSQWHDAIQDKEIQWEKSKFIIAILSEKENDIALELDTFVQICSFMEYVLDITTDSDDERPVTILDWREKLRESIRKFMTKYRGNDFSIKTVLMHAQSLGFQLEDDNEKFDKCKEVADLYVDCICTKLSSQSSILPLQGEFLKKLAHLEKKKKRPVPEETVSTEDFVNGIISEIKDQRKAQLQMIYEFTDGEKKFYKLLRTLQDDEFLITLMLVKLGIDGNPGNTDQVLGLESIVCELGQLFEATHLNNIHSDIDPDISLKEIFMSKALIKDFAQKAAELLILGQPIELLNGNASYIPAIWIKEILDRVAKLINNGKIFVLSVIGVQSSGKSTLLNFLFGSNFPTSPGRCTSGIFCRMLPVDKTAIKSDCDYVMILDAEGFGAPEFLQTSTVHDNEMATFIVGLSDLTIVNIGGETLGEMKDILQIVVYALLRIKQTKHKIEFMPSCFFVHQKVSSPDAGDKTKKGKVLTLKYLDEMAETSARREGFLNVTAFADVVGCNKETDFFILPNMWFGDPPFATVSSDYCRKVANLKSNVVSRIENKKTFLNVSDLFQRIFDLWQAILSENFVFNFRDIQQALAYQNLETAFLGIEWNFRNLNRTITAMITNKIMSLERCDDLYENEESINSELDSKFADNFEVSETALSKLLSSEVHKKGAEMFREDFKRKLQNLKDDEHIKTKRDIDKVFHVQKKILQNYEEIKSGENQILLVILEDINENVIVGDDKLLETVNNHLEMNFSSEKNRYEKSLVDAETKIHNGIEKLLKSLQNTAVPIYDKDSKSKSRIEIPEVTENDIVRNKDKEHVSESDAGKKKSKESSNSSETGAFKILEEARANEICKGIFNRCKIYLDTLNGHDFEESRVTPVFRFVASVSTGDFTLSYESLKKAEEQNYVENSATQPNVHYKDDEPNLETQLSHPIHLKEHFLDRYFSAIACYIRNTLYTFQRDFIERTEAYCIRQKRIEGIIIKRCREPEFMLATHIADETEKAALRNLSFIVSKLFQEHHKSFMTKKAFIAKLLNDFARKEGKEVFSKFLKFFTDFEDLCKEELTNCIQSFLKTDAICSIITAHFKTDTNVLVKKVQDDIIASFNECQNDIEDFLEAFRKRLDGKITFCPENAKVYCSEMSKYDTKSKSLREIADQLKADLELVSGIGEIDISVKLHNTDFAKSCAQYIYKEMLSGCCERCPFCSAPCLEQSKDHTPHVKHHSLHYPLGVRGIVQKKTWLQEKVRTNGKYNLVTEYCPSLIQSKTKFRSNMGQYTKWYHTLLFWVDWNAVEYRDYQTTYPNWHIPHLSEMDENDNDFWKWLMAKFGEEFAKKYNVSCSQIKGDWKLVKREEAISSIGSLLQDANKPRKQSA